ncbi:hypothetical protein K461DRAFT_222003 [Myriangium duriaei CBS 260.36]|uniref:Vacuolar protein sorting-associated protein 8 central domain-containing protein n=1 Tax=Myriangium duriaei CBS 260.36 TaxID=1168546 RepID=A0A9P4J625_9PEZI|nr:hypothetical protein K461DRAFT_222003 [Myriangium duriaei CBS 260.36]
MVLRTPSTAASPVDSGSIPDDTPSLKGSQASVPLTGTPSPRGSVSRTPSGAIKPFERRFQSRFSASPSPSRAASPAFLNTHSRQSSIASQVLSQNGESNEAPQAPWEVVRWTRLRKIAGQAFSEIGKRQLGTPTCLAVSASIVVGTSKGLILVFDYHQNLKGIIGQGTKAMEAGPITSLAISADYSTVAGGHASGHIFTWEIAKPAKPFLAISAVTRKDRESNAEGHIADRSVLHLGFLGTRHTALVSADDGGMAFSHLATRGFGAVGRTVKTTRLLGRYPTFRPEEDRQRKPSSVLAFAPLPLGNVEQATDTMGLTALLTPYLLVIVSTTPIAQTQHKASRPKDAAPHGAMSACLAWFPAVKLKMPVNGKETSESKLVYCWSDVLAVLEVQIGPVDPNDQDKQPSLSFRQRSRWRCEESIVAVQWLGRSVIAALTISQRLIILEDGDLHVMESVDLLHRHILHRDFFSKQLHAVVEQEETEADIHGVIADAFYMSFKAYKGRLFLMGYSDVSVGTLSNWADRLTALVEHGDDIAAIRLGVEYYQGSAGKVSVGLPEHAETRHGMVGERLLELLTASLRFRLSEKANDDDRLGELTTQCFDACLIMDEVDFLLDDAYELYRDNNESELFIETLEGYVMEGDIKSLPPILVKDVVTQYAASHRESRLEEMLCRLEAHLFDIDQVTRLCKQHLLYDALIYVWNQALSDWVTPMTDLFALIRDRNDTCVKTNCDHEDKLDAAMKIYPYLAFSLTGRFYPKGELMDDEQADSIRRDMYKILFSAHTITWPPGSMVTVRSVSDGEEEPAFPYLRLLLQFDTSNFMSMMNEAFEDAFLNSDQQLDYDEIQPTRVNGSATKMTRQQIISILLDTMASSDFDAGQLVYLDIFIARSLPKYPQFLILSASALQKILRRLTSVEDEDLADECQLSVEYLLSVYHPSMTEDLINSLRRARFYRVLKSIYRNENRWLDFVNTIFEDQSDREAVFQGTVEALQSTSGAKQRQAIEDTICTRAESLAFIDLKETVQVVYRHMVERLGDFVQALDQTRLQYAFLQALLEPGLQQKTNQEATAPKELLSRMSDQYIQLMCVHDPTHVAEFVSTLDSGDLHLNTVLPDLEKNGVVDAAVLLLTKDGLAREAMDRLVNHVKSLQKALCSLIESSDESPDLGSSEIAVKELQQEVDKYIKLGIWLCQGQARIAEISTTSPKSARSRNREISENDLTLDEYLWLTLVDLVVQVSQAITSATESLDEDVAGPIRIHAAQPSRSLVQQVFTALLSSTTTPSQAHSAKSASPSPHPFRRSQASFLPIFRLFLARAAASTPSLSDLRAVLLDIFSAYAYESDVLTLASQLLDNDAFVQLHAVHDRRQHGWRPRTQVCDRCKRRAFGPGVGDGVWGAWVDAETELLQRRKKREGEGKGKGKGMGAIAVDATDEEQAERKRLALVVFACKHVFHRQCLDGLGEEVREEGRYKCPHCEKRN